MVLRGALGTSGTFWRDQVGTRYRSLGVLDVVLVVAAFISLFKSLSLALALALSLSLSRSRSRSLAISRSLSLSLSLMCVCVSVCAFGALDAARRDKMREPIVTGRIHGALPLSSSPPEQYNELFYPAQKLLGSVGEGATAHCSLSFARGQRGAEPFFDQMYRVWTEDNRTEFSCARRLCKQEGLRNAGERLWMGLQQCVAAASRGDYHHLDCLGRRPPSWRGIPLSDFPSASGTRQIIPRAPGRVLESLIFLCARGLGACGRTHCRSRCARTAPTRARSPMCMPLPGSVPRHLIAVR